MQKIEDFNEKIFTDTCFRLGWTSFILGEDEDALEAYNLAYEVAKSGFKDLP